MIGFRWLSALMEIAPMQLGAEVERSVRRRRAAARMNTSVTTRVAAASGGRDRPSDHDGTGVEALRNLMSEVARRADR